MCSIALKEVEVHSSGTAGKRPTMDLNEAARACGDAVTASLEILARSQFAP